MDDHTERLAYNITAAVAVSGLTRTRLYEAMATGELPYAQVGRRRLIRRADLEALIAAHVVKGAA